MAKVKIGIIGGSGMNDPDIFKERKEKRVSTPYGEPSDSLFLGKIAGVECVLMPRHGRKHTIMPTDINYRANIYALKEEGCTHVVVTTACGSLKEEYKPGDLVFPDQFIDRTTKRVSTFYDGKEGSPVGICHIPMHDPYCPHTRKILIEAAKELNLSHHSSGTNVVVEGPRFSSKAESKMFKLWGGDIINMTAVPEVVLANEAGLCYAAIAMVTDYDCWRDDHEPVSVESVMAIFKSNVANVKTLLLAAIPRIASKEWTDITKERQTAVANNIVNHAS
ncbi:S-methyl-5'-thioadenosine phosphorylase-like [Orbicella faveolata]|uniref:S-methyl-5'-thioadenosine phosphorylase-like n=1 Tax=Orbicella faveolata TaxID=48498 RepID=UPI0009E39D0B|nr:S-methyl-5'-thioadenosine phosphorylase-like [Orbicella faveolata]